MVCALFQILSLPLQMVPKEIGGNMNSKYSISAPAPEKIAMPFSKI